MTTTRRSTIGLALSMVGLLLAGSGAVSAQGQSGAAPQQEEPPPVEAAEADGDVPKRGLVKFNEYQGKYFSARVGFGFLWDYATYSQDEDSKTQMSLDPLDDLRDFRFLLKGRLPIPRVTYTLGYMYDKAADSWRFRQTGIMVEIRKAYGSIFVGRTKEGFSTSKIMVGYQGWTNERATMNDALIPILGDGIKWSGTIPSGKFVYSVGYFRDTRSEKEQFNKNDKVVTARSVWLPLAGTEKVLHVALQARHALADDGFLRYRSKPESYQAQSYAIDTGQFAAEYANSYGAELYYRPGPFMFGSEYFFTKAKAPESGDPFIHGGEFFVAYLLTGETRPYNGRGAYFERVSPARPVFTGGRGPGAWELVTRFSYSDLDSGPIRGGVFWRLTPMANWHLSDHVRFEMVYGYGSLDRFDVTGKTHFFQSRIQFQL